MKEGWQIKPLQELCKDFRQDIVDGPFGSDMQRKDYLAEGIPVLKIQNVKPFAIELKKMDYVSPTKFQELKRHSYRRGDIVMTKLGNPLGASAIIENLDDGVIVADLVRIRAQLIDTKYLCYYLNSPRTNDFINSMQKGTTRPRVRLSVVRELPIFVPSPEEQQLIVHFLDKAFDCIAKAKANAAKNFQNARMLFESYLEKVFTQVGEGWHIMKLGEVLQKTETVNPLLSPKDKFDYIDVSSISNETFRIEETQRLKGNDAPSRARRLVKANDVLFATVRPTLRRIAIVPEELDNQVCSTGYFVLRPKPGLDYRFVFYFLFTEGFMSQMMILQKGASYPAVTDGEVRAQAIPVPPLPEQQHIVTRLESLYAETQHLESVYQRKLAALDELKKSLLHHAFNGEL